MPKYINSDDAVQCAANLAKDFSDEGFHAEASGAYAVWEWLKDIPAADVWEVVHCANCAHAEESLVSGCVYCNEMERARIKEGFCAWGERKES